MTHFDTLIIHANLATMNDEFGFGGQVSYGQILDGAIGISEGKIQHIAHSAKGLTADQVMDANHHWLTPALIDCHTHLVYAGNRSNEFEMRLNGVDYKTIANQGGGIVSTVKSVRQSSFDELYQASEKRLQALINQGVTTIEIKSGYGLDLENERKMLLVAQALGKNYGITVKKTYLAAHALPPEYKDQPEE